MQRSNDRKGATEEKLVEMKIFHGKRILKNVFACVQFTKSSGCERETDFWRHCKSQNLFPIILKVRFTIIYFELCLSFSNIFIVFSQRFNRQRRTQINPSAFRCTIWCIQLKISRANKRNAHILKWIEKDFESKCSSICVAANGCASLLSE